MTAGSCLGVQGSGGSVIVPPTEYDPTTGEDTGELVEVGPARAVESWAWVAHPWPKHPLPAPVRRGAHPLGRSRHGHAPCGRLRRPGQPGQRGPGDGAVPPAAERIGAMSDIEAFVPEAGGSRSPTTPTPKQWVR